MQTSGGLAGPQMPEDIHCCFIFQQSYLRIWGPFGPEAEVVTESSSFNLTLEVNVIEESSGNT